MALSVEPPNRLRPVAGPLGGGAESAFPRTPEPGVVDRTPRVEGLNQARSVGPDRFPEGVSIASFDSAEVCSRFASAGVGVPLWELGE